MVTALDYLFGEQVLWRPTLSAQFLALLVISSYILGQVISHLSAVVLEQWMVKRMLGDVPELLLASEDSKSGWAKVFPQYFHRMRSTTVARVMAQAERRGCHLRGNDLYDHCFAVVTESSERAQARMDYLKSQYGFTRNIAFAFFCSAVLVVLADAAGPHRVSLWWAVAAVALSVCMLYRYLKFYREYTSELFKRYAELPAITVVGAG